MHSFSSSLAKGQQAEALFLAARPDLKRLDGRKHDFVAPDGSTYELKGDQYDMSKTKNFFVELVSNSRKLSPGGPAQALKNGTKYWVYMYVKNKTYYIFDTVELVETIQNLLISEQLELRSIPNKKYATFGVKVPRKLLEHIYTEVRFDI